MTAFVIHDYICDQAVELVATNQVTPERALLLAIFPPKELLEDPRLKYRAAHRRRAELEKEREELRLEAEREARREAMRPFAGQLCYRGLHKVTEENTRYYTDSKSGQPYRSCLDCRRESDKRRRIKHREKRNAQARAYRDRKKSDPEYMERKRAANRAYWRRKQSARAVTPTPSTTSTSRSAAA